MTQNILRKLMLIVVLLTSSHAFAHDFEVNGIYYNITCASDLTVEVTFKGDYIDIYDREYTGNVRIPESVLYNGTSFSVTSIGNNVFESCDGLTSITIPKSVVNIGDYALNSCDNLNTIVIESGNARYDSRENCNAIIETATNTLIQGCNTTIIPNSVKNIFEYAFAGCIGLTSVNIPNSVTSIGDYAFCECIGLTLVTIGNYVTSIGNSAFAGCSSLTSATIPNSVTSIGNSAFGGCSSLTSVTIPNSVASIGESAFYGCSGLTSITIPNSVKNIGQAAFVECNSLAKVICKSSIPPTVGIYTFVTVPQTTILYVPAGSKEAYANATGWNYFADIVEMEFENETETTITIMDATNQGSVSFSYEEGKAFDFTVTPVTGYIVNTVLVNGEICEAEDGVYNIESVSEKTTISVSYELDPATSVNTLSTNNIKVYGCDNTLTVTGVEFGDTISVYDRNGTMLKTQNSVGSTNYISLDNGIYIVKVNGKSF